MKNLPIANSGNTRDRHRWQWANFTMGPNGQNQHFGELRQKVCLYIHAVVLLMGLPSLEAKNELFVGKMREELLAISSQTDYNSLKIEHFSRLVAAELVFPQLPDVWPALSLLNIFPSRPLTLFTCIAGTPL